MAVYFTSSVPHGNTEEVSIDRLPQYETRISVEEGHEGETEHVVYIRNVGEFASVNIDEIAKLFSQISGTIAVEKFIMSRPALNQRDAGNSGTH